MVSIRTPWVPHGNPAPVSEDQQDSISSEDDEEQQSTTDAPDTVVPIPKQDQEWNVYSLTAEALYDMKKQKERKDMLKGGLIAAGIFIIIK